MKDQILKIAGVKNEKEFYKKFPTQEVFMKTHGKEFKKAQLGTTLKGVDTGIGTYNKISRPPVVQEMDADLPNNLVNPNFGPKQQLQLEKYQANRNLQIVEDPEATYSNNDSAPSGDTAGMIGKGLGVISDLASGYSQLRGERQAKKKAQQWEKVTDVQRKAASTRPEQSERRYVRPEDRTTTGEELFPIYGTGTNVLAKDGTTISSGKDSFIEDEIIDAFVDGGEIQNTYAPNDIYNDLGYAPLPKAQNGFETFMTGQGGDKLSSIAGNIMGNDAGSNIGGTLGQTAGTLIGGPIGGAIGKIGGQLIGGLLDTNDNKIKKAKTATERNMNAIASSEFGQGLQEQNTSFMEHGGNINPQVISKFGNVNIEDFKKFASDGMDTLRSGGNLRENNKYAFGGELKTHWGGETETMSSNPFLPDGGETIMFRGQSHDDTDNKGNSGIGITFGNSPVEVERGEPAVKLKDGTSGEENLVVYGNLNIPKFGEMLLQDPKAKGKKFKNYIADISKTEASQNKLVDKNTKEVNDLQVIDSFDKLKLTSLKANLQGANMKLKSIADKKIKAATLQNAINDTAKEQGIVADDLANGIIKIDKEAMKEQAKNGGEFSSAQDGKKVSWKFKGTDIEKIDPKIKGLVELLENKGYEGLSGKESGYSKRNTKSGRASRHASNQALDAQFPNLKGESYNKLIQDPEVASYLIDNGLTMINEYDPTIAKKTGASAGHIHFGYDKGTPESDAARNEILKLYPNITQKNNLIPNPITKPIEGVGSGDMFSVQEDIQEPNWYTGTSTQQPSLATTPIAPSQSTDNKYKFNGLNVINSLIPYLRPSDAEDLDPRQLSGEMNALSQNQLEPVKAQLYNPQLDVPYDISLQEIRNENQADYRAAQRMAGYNPAALAILNAQKYEANQKVGAEEFRLNQAKKDQVYSGNRATLNDAQLKNLGILDQQYVRQEQAKSNTKDVKQLALNSIASKYAQNSLENKTLQAYENQYNYRYDNQGRLINMNPLANYNIPTVGKTASDPTDEYTKSKAFVKAYEDEQKKTIKSQTTPKRNGAIVNALKRL